jgi:hypothetical protein
MSQEVKDIYSEKPEIEQWNLLEIYAYPNNIIKYLNKEGFLEPDEKIVVFIANSIVQAKEYFSLSKKATLYTQPVLVYYGYIHLLGAYYTLKKGSLPSVKNHGMELFINSETIGDIQIHMNNEHTGALAIFGKLVSTDFDIRKFKDFRIRELLSVIAEIQNYFLASYSGEPIHILPVEKIVHNTFTEEKVENATIQLLANSIEGFRKIDYIKNNYLPIQFNEKSSHTFLRRKITFTSNSVYSVFNRKYIPIPFESNSSEIYINSKLSMLMILYALSVLCRYHSSIWNKFVKLDISGEKLVIQSFLAWCIRLLPNYILNDIEGKVIRFSTKEQGVTNKKNDNESVKKLIEDIVSNHLRER